MRLFGKVDGVINCFDRAQWMTPPFDLWVGTPTVAEDLFARVDEATQTYRRSGESDLNYPRLDESQTGYRRI